MQRQSFENIGEDSDVSFWSQPAVDTGHPPPEPVNDEPVQFMAEPSPYWAHRKIVHIDAHLSNHPSFFGNRPYIGLQTQYIPRKTANDRWIGGYSSAPGDWLIFDFDAGKWRPGKTRNHCWQVRIRNGGGQNDLFYGMYFCPDAGLDAFTASNPLVLWVQNFHMEGNQLIWEGGTPPNNGNIMGIDCGIGYPFPGGGRSYRFPG